MNFEQLRANIEDLRNERSEAEVALLAIVDKGLNRRRERSILVEKLERLDKDLRNAFVSLLNAAHANDRKPVRQ